MLKRFEVRNFKNFRDSVIVDFSKVGGYQFNQDCLTNGNIGKMIIYGKNATGKTNLGWALMNIWSNLLGITLKNAPFLNVDSDEGSAYFRYDFVFDETSLIYEYRKRAEKVLTEETLKKDGRTVFSIDFDKNAYDTSGLHLVQAETLVFERYKQFLSDDEKKGETLPFLRWILANTALSDESVLLRLINYVRGMNFSSVGDRIVSGPRGMQEEFLEYLDEGDHLADLTAFLNQMGISCKLAILQSPDGTKNLYFDNKTPIPFVLNASSGTLALFRLYQKITMAANASSFLYMDEFDAFYHYEMAENVVRFLIKKYPKCQIILTTHNTNLMTNRFMRPDCLFILSQSGHLTALCNATSRELREGHNLEKMYISGEFEPYE